MLLSCWSQHDGLRRWQAHASAEKKWEGSSGQRTACQGASTLLFVLPSFFSPHHCLHLCHPPWAPPSALYHPRFRPSEPLSAILLNWSLTCNVPLSATGEVSRRKGQNIYNKVSRASEVSKRGTIENSSRRDVMEWRLHEKSLNIFSVSRAVEHRL